MDSWVPDSCTLPTTEQPLRVAEFAHLLAEHQREAERLAPTHARLRLTGGPDLERRVRDLLARENECCSFFTFAVTGSSADLIVDVRVPSTRTEVLDGLVP